MSKEIEKRKRKEIQKDHDEVIYNHRQERQHDLAMAALQALKLQSDCAVDKCLADIERIWATGATPERTDHALNTLELLLSGWKHRFYSNTQKEIPTSEIWAILDDFMVNF